MVDGVLASCYPSGDHDLSQIGMSPIKWFPNFTKWIFGDDKNLQVYVGLSTDLGRWVLPHMLTD